MGSTVGKFLTSGLTHTAVTGPDGTTYYKTPQEAAAAASQQIPSTESLIGGSVLNPTLATPSNLPTIENKATNLSKVLNLGLHGLVGAAAGSGRISAGEGALAGIQANSVIDETQRENANAQAYRNYLAAKASELQSSQAAQNAETAAKVDYYRAGTQRRSKFLVPGVGLTDEDGTVIVPEPQKGTELDDPESRKTYIDQADPDKHLLSGADRLGFIATGKWPAAAKERGPSLMGWIEDANNPDPNVSGPAKQNIATYKNTMHSDKPGATLDGMSANQQRALRNDAVWSGLNKRYAALTGQYAKQMSWDPEGATALGNQLDIISGQMDARASEVLGKKGKLKLKGSSNFNATIPLLSSHGPTYTRTATNPKTGEKLGWNGQQWVSINAQ